MPLTPLIFVVALMLACIIVLAMFCKYLKEEIQTKDCRIKDWSDQCVTLRARIADRDEAIEKLEGQLERGIQAEVDQRKEAEDRERKTHENHQLLVVEMIDWLGSCPVYEEVENQGEGD